MLAPAILVGLRFVPNFTSEINAALASLRRPPTIFRVILMRKFRARPSFTMASPAPAIYISDKAACSAFLLAVREEYTRFTGILTINPDGSLFCDAANRPDPRSQGSRILQAGPGYARRRHARARIRPADGDLGVADRLPVRPESGELKFILLASFNLRKFADVSRQAPVPNETEICWSTAKASPGCARGERTGPSRPAHRSRTRNCSALRLTQPRAVPRGNRSGGPNPCLGRLPAPLWAAMPEIDILVGRPKDRLVAAANRRLYEDLAMLAVASLLLFAGVWILATVSVGRQVGRLAAMATKLGLGDLSARIAPPHPRGELGGLMTLLNGTAELLERQRAAIDELNQKIPIPEDGGDGSAHRRRRA